MMASSSAITTRSDNVFPVPSRPATPDPDIQSDARNRTPVPIRRPAADRCQTPDVASRQPASTTGVRHAVSRRVPISRHGVPDTAVTAVAGPSPLALAGGELVEQLVLSAFELGDPVDDVLAMARHGGGVLAGIVRLLGGARRLGDQRPDRLVLGVAGEHVELLVDLRQLGAQ